MKTILISIKPRHCSNIAKGIKKIEVRKSKPKLETPFKCYIYMTKSEDGCYSDWEYPKRQKVIGEYVCDEIYQYTTCDFKDGTDIDDETMTRLSCLSKSEIKSYELSPGQFGVFGWHISNLKIYEKPKELSEFRIIDKEYLTKCPYRSRIYNNPDYTNGALLKGSFVCVDDGEPDFCRGQCKGAKKPLTRPPQSWCYVEEINV